MKNNKKYALHGHCSDNKLIFEEKNPPFYLLDNLEEYEKEYQPSIANDQYSLEVDKREVMNATKSSTAGKGAFHPIDGYNDSGTPLAAACSANHDAMGYASLIPASMGDQINIGKTGTPAFYPKSSFCRPHNVGASTSEHGGFNKYAAMFYRSKEHGKA